MTSWHLCVVVVVLTVQENRGQNWLPVPQVVNVVTEWKEQRISVTWADGLLSPNFTEKLLFDIEILQDEWNHVVHHEKLKSGDHSWSWTSPIPLECTSHSVRVRSRHQQLISQWSIPHTIPGNDISSPKTIQVYPKDRVVHVGSITVFCCIVTEGHERIGGADMNVTRISNRSYEIVKHNLTPSPSAGYNLKCTDTSTASGGTTFWVGYSPNDQELVCETDLVSVECHWSRPRNTELFGRRETQYTLNGRKCKDLNHGKQLCKCSISLDQGEKYRNLTARNPLGSVELMDREDLNRRIRMQAPLNMTISEVHARNVTIQWNWKVEAYKTLPLMCRVQLNHSDHKGPYNNTGLSLLLLTDLQPDRSYRLQVCCGTDQHFWEWGSWSSVKFFQTKVDRPDALDIWIQRTSVHKTLIMWKCLSANDSHGQIRGYNVTLESSMGSKKQWFNVSRDKLSFLLELGDSSEDHVITVTALNSAGSSPPSTIGVPRLPTDNACSEVSGSNGSFDLSWPASANASCGYIVDWRPTHSWHNGTVEWVKVPAGITRSRIVSGNFKAGVRYSLSIYTCSQGAPELMEKKEGYVKEMVPAQSVQKLQINPSGPDVLLHWDRIPLESQQGFVRGYFVYKYDTSSRLISIENITDPDATTHTLRNLPHGSYKFIVKAYTSAGEGLGATASIKLDPESYGLIVVTLIALGSMACLFFFITIICYQKRKWMKEKIYPEIPKPKLPEWSALPVWQTLDLIQCPYDRIIIVESEEGLLEQWGGEGERHYTPDTDSSGPHELRCYDPVMSGGSQRPRTLVWSAPSSQDSSGSLGSRPTEVTYTGVQTPPTPAVSSGLPSPQDALSSEDYRPQISATFPMQPQSAPSNLPLLQVCLEYQPHSQHSLSPETGSLGGSLGNPTYVNSFTFLLNNTASEKSQEEDPSSSSLARFNNRHQQPFYCNPTYHSTHPTDG
ncbi:hypothetical protein AAFF_G00047120 [Aldrovandia affinis]|uniref:Fibronectin type-III domain-containing protein n=1 Tax=Aldrovandia affinis TaxID=143900 RepID=A0AAD7WF54_9TELE|nr:hypothetical protein AAFF_G00047120 [Aldrovandia affinis]